MRVEGSPAVTASTWAGMMGECASIQQPARGATARPLENPRLGTMMRRAAHGRPSRGPQWVDRGRPRRRRRVPRPDGVRGGARLNAIGPTRRRRRRAFHVARPGQAPGVERVG